MSKRFAVRSQGRNTRTCNIDDVPAGVYLDKDGQGDPANIALALAKGARQRGCQCEERTKVDGRDP